MNRSISISLVLTIVAVVWVLSGSIESAKDEAPNAEINGEDTPQEQVAFKVQVQTRLAESMIDRLSLQGQVEASRVVELKAEATGVVNRIDSQKGDRMSFGGVVLALDLSDRVARLEEAKALLRVQELELESGKKLLARNMLSSNQHQQNLANVAAAKAQVKAIQEEINNTILHAPFDGVLNELHVEIGDYVAHGDPLAQFVDNTHSLISVEVPQQHIAGVKLGQRVVAELLDGTKAEGKVSYISSSANTATRTFRIEAKVVNNTSFTHFGQSARVVIDLGERLAHKLSPSLLDLNSEGNLQVKAVDPSSRVILHPVEIVRSEQDGVWLSGLPDSLELITVGHGFVAEGQRVEAVKETDAREATL